MRRASASTAAAGPTGPIRRSASRTVGADPGRAFDLEVYADDEGLRRERIEAGAAASGPAFTTIEQDLSRFTGRDVTLRVYQRVLIPDRLPGNAHWKTLEVVGAESR